MNLSDVVFLVLIVPVTLAAIRLGYYLEHRRERKELRRHFLEEELKQARQ